MSKVLTHKDIIIGHKYKVVRNPIYLPSQFQYGEFNKIGVAISSNENHGVSLKFNDHDRIVPVNCLEEVAEEKINVSDKEITFSNITIGKYYLVYKTPSFFKDVAYNCPAVGKIGRVIHAQPNGAVLIFGKQDHQHFISYDCLQEYNPIQEMEEKDLIQKIKENPQGALKIIKGLAKMTKDFSAREFIEIGKI